ncbi:MAG: DoxX family protein [Rhizobacter sp.]|nr:DoxX family protein [Chlorobiales bacterium]
MNDTATFDSQGEASPQGISRFEWSKAYFSQHLLQGGLIVFFLIVRTGFAAFFIYGFWHKLTRGWLTSDVLLGHFTKRLSELDPQHFSAFYLSQFAIPLYQPIAWIVIVGEFIAGVCLLVGLCTRANGWLSLFLLLNFSAGAFFNITMPPFLVFALLVALLPSGQWLGLDQRLHAKYPNSIWFR